jgi:hypothetical protein
LDPDVRIWIGISTVPPGSITPESPLTGKRIIVPDGPMQQDVALTSLSSSVMSLSSSTILIHGRFDFKVTDDAGAVPTFRIRMTHELI